MKIIFCSDPLNSWHPDTAYEDEVVVVNDLGIEYALINFEALVDDNDPVKATRRVRESPKVETAIYRGWMLKPNYYSLLYDALLGKGIRLINDPAAYIHCHYLPESYSTIESSTPRSVWMKIEEPISIDRMMDILLPFGSKPVVLKDFVKSEKHNWDEACYISAADNRGAVEHVVRRFIELRGADLNEGLVFREFVEFEPLTHHSKSGMPLTKEFRIFFLDAEPINSVNYWGEGDYGETVPPVEQFRDVARQVQSRFFTMDVAKRLNGNWMIVELGDAQVAGLPDNADVLRFYRALIKRMRADGRNLKSKIINLQ